MCATDLIVCIFFLAPVSILGIFYVWKKGKNPPWSIIAFRLTSLSSLVYALSGVACYAFSQPVLVFWLAKFHYCSGGAFFGLIVFMSMADGERREYKKAFLAMESNAGMAKARQLDPNIGK